MWHKIYSVPFTEVLGKVACRVTSKILGVGNAERAWGCVKHLKTDKRAHLGAETTKKQATIFGKAAIEAARAKQNAAKGSSKYNNDNEEGKIWSNEDDAFGIKLGLPHKEELSPQPRREVFRAWEEPWEKACIKTNDPVAEQRLLHKYGGMSWIDPDNEYFWHGQTKCSTTEGGKVGGGAF